MRRTFLIIAVLALTLISSSAWSATIESDLGYKITLPDGWVYMDKSKLKDDDAVIDAAMETARQNQNLSTVPKQFWADIKRLIGQGKLDYYFSNEPRFNLSVYPIAGNLSGDANSPVEFCNQYQAELAKEKQPIGKAPVCELQPLDNRFGIRVVTDGTWTGKKYIQVLVQRSKDHILMFTATTMNSNFDEMAADFDKVMSTVRIN